MENEVTSEPTIGPTEHKVKPHLHVNHKELNGLEDAALNHRVKLVVTGRIISNRAKDQYGDGSAEIEIDTIEHQDAPKKENAATMHMDKLKAKLPKVEEKEEKEDSKEDEE